jgi:hypothetical protein
VTRIQRPSIDQVDERRGTASMRADDGRVVRVTVAGDERGTGVKNERRETREVTVTRGGRG